MEEYLYQKEYVMLNNMQLHLSNPEPMLKYIDEKVEKLIKAKSKNEEINIKLEILDEFYKILKYDAKNTICPEPLGHFETKEEKDELIKKKIKINDLVYYLGNICINYHKKLISKEYRGRVPIITNEATIKFNEIYIRALNEYFETLRGNEYKGIFENPPKKQQNLQIIRMIEYSGVVFPMAEPLTNNKIECIRDEHAYGTAFILPTLIERFLIIQLDSKILKNLMKELKDKIEKENIKLTDEEKQYYNIITEKGDKTIFASEKFIRANIYKMFIKYQIISENDDDIKLLILHEYIDKKDDKKRKNKLTLGSVIASPYANSLIKKQYTKLLNLIFEPNELNMRNNIAHINNENSDYLCLGDTAVLMQLLWDIITEDIFE